MSESPTTSTKPRAVILLSGGLDSATTLAVARARGFDCHALTIDYGQRHRHELDAARRVAQHLRPASHAVERLDLRLFGGSALTADIPVPKDRLFPSPEAPSPGPIPGGGGGFTNLRVTEGAPDIPITYVPARNLIFLSIASAFAEVLEARHLFIGVNAVDYSGYPDCRPDFIRAFERAANLATKAAVTGSPLAIHTPLIDLSKADIIRLGLSLGVDYALTHSCYDPGPAGDPCRRCDSCLLRARGFAEAGLPDPAGPAR